MISEKNRPAAANSETAKKLWTGSRIDSTCSSPFLREGFCDG
ncbi:hypothetical protein ABIB51_004342 [Arthrobacter sp. UYCu712]